MSKDKEYVYVTWDPLTEEVVCVHKNKDSTCEKCQRLIDKRKTIYQPEVGKFLLQD